MFAKLVVLIMVFGASGVGVLSVRQSRLQAVHEMAESRHRIRQLDEQAGEVRTLIVQTATPQRVHQMLVDRGYYSPASKSPAQLQLVQDVLEETADIPVPDLQQHADADLPDDAVVMTLEDGTRVVFVRDRGN